MKCVFLIISGSFLIFSCSRDPFVSLIDQDEALHLNELQIIASHNSYRTRTTDTIFSFLQSIVSFLPPNLNPAELDYSHLPLADQLNDYKVRGFELDIYYDLQGGAFNTRQINSYVGLDSTSGIPELALPGFKVLHIKDIDYNTHHYTFVSALQEIKTWSSLHPNHVPLFINVETKNDSPGDDPTLAAQGFQTAPQFDVTAADAIDDELKSVFGNDLEGILTPDDLRGSCSTLEEVALGKKWPSLKESRGKIIFIMEGACTAYYIQNHPSLSGRAMFVYAQPGTPEAAFVILNDALADFQQIHTYVEQGYIVRTRCDAGTTQARSGDYSNMNAAFSSGAQICSTDYYKADVRAGQLGWSAYAVFFPDNMLARKNPVSAAGINTYNRIDD